MSSLSFGEPHNKVLHHVQMDFQVRFWNIEKRRYVQGILHPKTLPNILMWCCLNMFNLLQISSSGPPAVNLKFLREMDGKRADLEVPSLVGVATCGLHTQFMDRLKPDVLILK